MLSILDSADVQLEPGQYIAWEPTERQAELLACEDFEVLYGGAAGGGKTDGMLIDAWCAQYGGINNPNHRAVIFRKSFTDLKDLIDRALSLLPRFIPGIKYNKQDHVFTAPSGAKLELAYLDNDETRYKYRGRAWNYVGFEELTLWPTDVCYEYMFSRCRTTDRTLPCFVRATSNPDGPGQRWVMLRWAIEERGLATLQEREVEFETVQADGKVVMEKRMIRRRFIPARLIDNPHLRGTGYRERLMDMPPDDRDALLLGLWTGNKVRGAYYVKEMQRARAEGRICRVPFQPGVPVNTFWDLGWNDDTVIGFHQRVGVEDRWLKSYQNSGEDPSHYVAFLQTMQAERGYIYGRHYLPHDAEHKTLASRGKSLLKILRELWPGQKWEVVARVEDLLVGIQQTRMAFRSCYFDKDECAELIAALDGYRKKWDKTLEVFTDVPVEDRFVHQADMFRQFGQGFVAPKRKDREGGTEAQEAKRRKREASNNWRTS